MFEQRLKILLWIMVLPVLVLIGRLVQLQILNADAYREEARQVLVRPPITVACTRGRILDRRGLILAEDRACWDVCVPYRVLAGDKEDRAALAAELKKTATSKKSQINEADVEELQRRIDATWPAIAEATGASLADIAERREQIVLRIRKIHELIRARGGIDRTLAEERRAHPVVRGLDHAAKVKAELALAEFPWVQVTDSTSRWYLSEPSLGHVLGKLQDPGADEVFGQDLSPELRGVNGVERLAEKQLRGQRGSVFEDIEGEEVAPPVEARNGEDARMTIDLGLQQQIYKRLEQAVAQNPIRAGAAAVVLDVQTREVLALVSYPAYDPNPTPTERMMLRMDRQTQPMQFRAVAEQYPPGSIIKPLILAGALTGGSVGPDTTLECQGRLFADNEKAFRCLGIHGAIAGRAALAHSCNVYFYKVGERMGVPYERAWFRAVGLGQVTGTGLAEERPGRLPADISDGAARNIAVGQGELEITPVQAANLIASLADGEYRSVKLLADDPRPQVSQKLEVSPAHLKVVREGLYSVVNEPGGTAYSKMLPPPQPWVLLGKTGSATGWVRELERLYVCEWPDGTQETYIATDGAELRQRLANRGTYKIVKQESFSTWPPVEDKECHAWFVGYLIPKAELSDLSRPPSRAVAMAILVEYAGHGGAISAPVAGDVARMVLDVWPGQG